MSEIQELSPSAMPLMGPVIFCGFTSLQTYETHRKQFRSCTAVHLGNVFPHCSQTHRARLQPYREHWTWYVYYTLPPFPSLDRGSPRRIIHSNENAELNVERLKHATVRIADKLTCPTKSKLHSLPTRNPANWNCRLQVIYLLIWHFHMRIGIIRITMT